MGSTRLPGKVLLPLNGHTVLEEVLARCSRIRGIDEVICATSDQEQDRAIVYTIGWKYTVVCGSEHDVLSRYQEAVKYNGNCIIMRITADCPHISPELCSAVMKKRDRHAADYASNILPRTFPRGLDCEVFTRDLLDLACRKSKEREHVTTWMQTAPDIKRVNVASPWPMDGRLCLDNEDDYRSSCVRTAACNRSSSSISGEAILIAGTPNTYRKRTALALNAEEKRVISSAAAYSNSSRCHSRGVCRRV